MCCTTRAPLRSVSRSPEFTFKPLLQWGGTVFLGILSWVLALGFIAFVAVIADRAFNVLTPVG